MRVVAFVKHGPQGLPGERVHDVPHPEAPQAQVLTNGSVVGNLIDARQPGTQRVGTRFVTLTLTAVSGVAPNEAGAASGPLNASRQAGGSPGRSILVTVFGTASRTEAAEQVPPFAAQADPAQLAAFRETGRLPDPWGDLVLTQGVSTAFTAAVAMAGLALATALLVIRVRRSDLAALNGAAGAAGPAA